MNYRDLIMLLKHSLKDESIEYCYSSSIAVTSKIALNEYSDSHNNIIARAILKIANDLNKSLQVSSLLALLSHVKINEENDAGCNIISNEFFFVHDILKELQQFEVCPSIIAKSENILNRILDVVFLALDNANISYDYRPEKMDIVIKLDDRLSMSDDLHAFNVIRKSVAENALLSDTDRVKRMTAIMLRNGTTYSHNSDNFILRLHQIFLGVHTDVI